MQDPQADATDDTGHPAAETEGVEDSVTQISQYSFSIPPQLIASASASAAATTSATNFFRSAKWCPDGSCVLTHEENRLAKIFALPPDLLDCVDAQTLQPYLSLPASPAALLGLEWFPFASSQRPETFCFVRSCRDVPVSLVDGITGKIRASYPIIDHQERFIGPQCMTFSLDGRKLYCGFDSAIETFDVGNPGNNGTRFSTSPSRKSRTGQKGLISSIAFAPDYSGIMAAGSYSRSVWLYDTTGGEAKPICTLKSKDKEAFGGGVTQTTFHPASPEILYTAARDSDRIMVWDTRNTNAPLMEYHRPGTTNQRLQFSIDARGRWLTTGDTNGSVHFFDTQDLVSEKPAHSFKLDNDTISSASLHPYLPYLLTASGSRRLLVDDSGTSESASDSDLSDDDLESCDTSMLLQDSRLNTGAAALPRTTLPNAMPSSRMAIWRIS